MHEQDVANEAVEDYRALAFVITLIPILGIGVPTLLVWFILTYLR